MNPSLKSNAICMLPPKVMACLVDKLSLQSVARLSATCREVNISTIKALKDSKLIKREFCREVDEAFALGKPITFKLRYFSYEARKKPSFNIKNTDRESLRKIRSSGNIKLLLQKKVIEREDLDFLFDGDLAILEFLFEESGGLFSESFEEIPSEENASYICQYIIKNKLSFSEAVDLTPAELANLASRNICYYVMRAGLNINKAKNLSALESSILSQNSIRYLIETWKLPVEKALMMSDDEFSILSNRLIYDLVARGELPFEGIKKLTVDEIENAIKIGSPTFLESEPYETFWVLRRLGMSIEQILALDYDQIVRLSRHSIHKLLRCKKLTLEKAVCLTEAQASILGSRLLCKLFLADKLSLEEAEKLPNEERGRLKFTGICKLIIQGRVRLEDAVNPDRQEVMYKLRRLYEFICEDKVSVDVVEALSEEQVKVFESRWISDLIWKEILEMKDAARLSVEQIRKVDSEWIYNLVKERFLSVDEAFNLSEGEFDNLNDAQIYNLIMKGKLAIEEAKGLSVDRYDILSSVSVSSAICLGRMSLDDAKALALENVDDDTAREDVIDEEWPGEGPSENEAYENVDS